MFNADEYLKMMFASVIRSDKDLKDYQNYAFEWLKQNRFGALFIDVGLGKTVIILTLIDWLIQTKGYGGKILVIAPIKVINRVWAFEHTLWAHTAYLRVHNLRIEDDDPRLDGYKAKARTERKEELRVEQLGNPAQIHLINQEAVPWLVKQFVELRFSGTKKKVSEKAVWPYQLVVFDESSRLRDHASEVFVWLKRVRHRIRRLHELTATPSAQTYMYLFSQVWLMDKGDRFGDFITHFRKRYFTQDPYNRKWELRPDAAELIEKKIADICLVMRQEEYGDISNPIIRQRPIRLDRKTREKYRYFRENLVLETDEKTIEAVNSGALSGKLLQLASGAVYDELGKAHVFHDEKIDELKLLMEETLDEPILVAYWFKSSLDRLKKAFPKALVMDSQGKAEAAWNARKYKMMFIHPASAGHGLNLQLGGHHLVVFDMFWSLELFLQLIGRINRQGQTNQVVVHLLSVIGTEDRTVSSRLEVMEDAQTAFFARLRALHKRIKG